MTVVNKSTDLSLVTPDLSYSSSDEWHSKSQCTQKEYANHMDINCNSNEFILIGWSHYGTKKSSGIRSAMKTNQQRYVSLFERERERIR